MVAILSSSVHTHTHRIPFSIPIIPPRIKYPIEYPIAVIKEGMGDLSRIRSTIRVNFGIRTKRHLIKNTLCKNKLTDFMANRRLLLENYNIL